MGLSLYVVFNRYMTAVTVVKVRHISPTLPSIARTDYETIAMNQLASLGSILVSEAAFL